MEVYKPELALFDPPEVQTAIVRGAWVDIYPTNLNLNSGSIEFDLVANDDYIDLNDTILSVNISIVKGDGSALASGNDIAFVNYPLHSIFSDVMVYFNGERVDGGDQYYAYKAMLSTLFAYSAETLGQQMLSAGYCKDTAGEMNDVSKNKGHTERAKWNAGRLYIGRLLNDVFQQPRYLLSGVNVRIKLIRNVPEFAIRCGTVAEGTKPKFVINSAKLSTRRVRVADNVAIDHANALTKQNALYPFPQKRIQTYNMTKGSKSFIKENLYNGKLPKMMVVSMVSADAYNGTYGTNPYNFQHFGVNLVSLKRDGESIPAQPYEPNFSSTSTDYLREYMSIYIYCNLMGREDNLSFNHDDFGKGYTFFVFNLQPDLSMVADGQAQNSNLRLELKFSEALTETVTVIVFAVFDGILEIDQFKNAYITNI